MGPRMSAENFEMIASAKHAVSPAMLPGRHARHVRHRK